MYRIARVRTTFGTCDVEKWHTAVARSTFASQNAKKLTVLAHFWKLRRRKMARRCGAKHICKSKCAKDLRSGPLLEVRMWKNGTSLWHEAHLQVKMPKNWRVRTSFWRWDVSKLCKIAHRCGAKHIYKSKCKKHMLFAPFLEVSDVKKCQLTNELTN